MIHPKFALRYLLRSPIVTAVAVLSLGLGIGANAAIFTLFEQLLMRPLPVEAPERLVNLKSPGVKAGSNSSSTAGNTESVFSYPMFRDLEQAAAGSSTLVAHRSFGANFAFQGQTSTGQGSFVSGSYFEGLGLQPVIGRLIQRRDDEKVGGHPVAVLSYEYWQKRFGGESSVLDQSLIVNGKPVTIIGVAPKGFHGTVLGENPQAYVPITMREELIPGWTGLDNRRSYWVYVFGRLAEGKSLEQARAALNVTYQRILREVEAPLQEGMSTASLARFRTKELVMEPGRRGQSNFHDEVRVPFLLLMGVTGLVLLIACANLTNLLLIRATQRSGEIAVRMSIGAQRRQVVGQLLMESFLLSIFGAAVGFVVAMMTLRGLAALLPGADEIGISLQIGQEAWIFMAVLTTVIGFVGLFPALQATRENYAVTLKTQSGRTSSRSANRFRAGLATAQIALSMMLLISAGLLIKSLVNVSRVDLGLDVDEMVSFYISPDLNGYDSDQSREFFKRVEQQIAALPGVESISASLVPLISDSNWGSNVSVQGFDAGPDTDTNSRYNEVGPGFFRTMGIPLIAGRDIEESDVLDAGKVAIVNETFARKFDIDPQKAVGTWMQVGSGGEMDIQIVGLVKDSKYSQVKGEIPPVFVLPYRQNEHLGSMGFYVRASGDPRALIPSIRQTVSTLDPNLPVDELQTFSVVVEENIMLDRLLSSLSSAFALLATLLAAIGLYGVLAFTVVQRHREIGLRMALGADAGDVRSWVLKKVLIMVGIGGTVGAAAALGLGRFAESLLFGMEGHDPVVFVIAVAALSGVALTAGWLPAHRASKIHPIEALRDD